MVTVVPSAESLLEDFAASAQGPIRFRGVAKPGEVQMPSWQIRIRQFLSQTQASRSAYGPNSIGLRGKPKSAPIDVDVEDPNYSVRILKLEEPDQFTIFFWR
ncbi:MAG TPA: hypothetical protein VK463_07880 [Desulfomonilaceae bacterium]|nr:hypothetical protein [Desulfomonilaceae bacterium]